MLAVIMVAIIAFVGYYVYHTQSQSNKTLNSATQVANSSPSKSTKKATAASTPVNPLLFQDNAGVTLYSISLLAKTADQKAIGAVLDKQCEGIDPADGSPTSDTVVASTGDANLFTNTDPNDHNFRQEGDLAIINMGCYDKTKGGEPNGGGALYYVYDKNGTWTFLTASQSQIDCSTVDGKGITSSLLTTCFDSTTGETRAPKS